MYYIYKYIKKNECVYIGKTDNLLRRHGQHINKKDWLNNETQLYYLEVPDKNTMDFIELYFLNKLKPRYNLVSKNSVNSNFMDLTLHSEWKPFNINNFECEKIPKGPYFKWELENKHIEIIKELLHTGQEIKIDIITKSNLNYKEIWVKVKNLNRQYLEIIPKKPFICIKYSLGNDTVSSAVISDGYIYKHLENDELIDLNLIYTVNLDRIDNIINKLSILFDVDECIQQINEFLNTLGLDIKSLKNKL